MNLPSRTAAGRVRKRGFARRHTFVIDDDSEGFAAGADVDVWLYA
jgi:hypothetical protein